MFIYNWKVAPVCYLVYCCVRRAMLPDDLLCICPRNEYDVFHDN